MSNSAFLDLLTPDNSQVLFIDQQPQMAFGVQSIDRQTLKNNVVALAKAAKVFGVPTTITTVETESFSGHTYPELLAVFPDNKILERTSMNSWDDQNVRDALAATGKKKIVVSGLWTEVCNLMFALCGDQGRRATRSTWWRTLPAARRPTRTNMRWTAWCRPASFRSPGSRCCSNGSATGRRKKTYDATI